MNHPLQTADVDQDYQNNFVDSEANAQQTTIEDKSPEALEAKAFQQKIDTSSKEEESKLFSSPQKGKQATQTQSDLERLQEILGYFDVPEEEVLEILARLSVADKNKVVSDHKDQLNACLSFPEMKQAVQILDLTLEEQLTWINDSAFFGTFLTYYTDIKDLVVAAPQSERDALKTDHWKTYFQEVCNDAAMMEALEDLNFDNQTKLAWLRHEGATEEADKMQVANAMEEGVKNGDEADWLGSGASGSTDFAEWARSDPSLQEKAPNIQSGSIMNCWEYILLTAHVEGIASQQWVHNLYTNVPQADWETHMIGGATPKEYTGPTSKEKPSRGDLIFFDGLSHVALSAGGDDIYSFWPNATLSETITPAGQDYNGDGTDNRDYGEFRVDGVVDQALPSPDKVELTTIHDLKTTRMGASVKVTFGAPGWE